AFHTPDCLFFQQATDEFDQSQNQLRQTLFDALGVDINPRWQSIRDATEFLHKLLGMRSFDFRFSRKGVSGGMLHQFTPNLDLNSRSMLVKLYGGHGPLRRKWRSARSARATASPFL